MTFSSGGQGSRILGMVKTNKTVIQNNTLTTSSNPAIAPTILDRQKIKHDDIPMIKLSFASIKKRDLQVKIIIA